MANHGGQKRRCSKFCCGFFWFLTFAVIFFIFSVVTWNSRMATNWVENTQYAPAICAIESVANCPADCQGSSVSGWRCECYATVSLDDNDFAPAWTQDPLYNPMTICYNGVSTYSPLSQSWEVTCGTYSTNDKTAWPDNFLPEEAVVGDRVECFYNMNDEQPNIILFREFFIGWFTLVVVLFCVSLAFVTAFGWCCYQWKCKRPHKASTVKPHPVQA